MMRILKNWKPSYVGFRIIEEAVIINSLFSAKYKIEGEKYNIGWWYLTTVGLNIFSQRHFL